MNSPSKKQATLDKLARLNNIIFTPLSKFANMSFIQKFFITLSFSVVLAIFIYYEPFAIKYLHFFWLSFICFGITFLSQLIFVHLDINENIKIWIIIGISLLVGIIATLSLIFRIQSIFYLWNYYLGYSFFSLLVNVVI